MLAAVLLCGGAEVTRAQIITSPQRISPIIRTQSEPAIAASGSDVVAVWFSRIFWDGTGWALSADGGTTWTPEGGFPGAEPNVFKIEGQHPSLSADDLGQFYSAVRTAGAGSGISVYRGAVAFGGLAWQGPVTVGPGDFSKDVESPNLACDPAGQFVYLAYTEIQKSLDPPIGGHVITFARSTDSGMTFEPRISLSGEFAGDPRVAVGPAGEVYVLWHDYATDQVLLRKSIDHGATFSPPVSLATMGDNVSTYATSWESSFIRRNPYYHLLVRDFMPNAPSVAVDRSGGLHHGTLYSVWSARSDGAGTPVNVLNETEPNNSFGTANAISLGQEARGVAIDPGKLETGDQDRFYFDGVAGTTVQIEGELTGISPEPPFLLSVPLFFYCGDDTTRLLRLASVTMARPGDGPNAPVIYTLPRTGRYWLATPPASNWSYAYRIRLRERIAAPGSAARDHRDVVIVRSSDGGATWSEKMRVNDCTGDDDVFPEVVVDELGQVHVAWYCKRQEVNGCGTLTDTYWTVSTDGGQSFRPARRVSSTSSPWECSGGGPNIGNHLGLAAAGGRVHIAWTEVGCPDSVDIYTARIEDIATSTAIARFVAHWTGAEAVVSWRVSGGEGIAAFRVQRASGAGSFVPLGPEIAYRGDGDYEQIDAEAAEGQAYRYRLEVIHRDGSRTWQGPIELTTPAEIRRLAWSSVAPNPFRDAVALELAVPRRGPLRVRIYDVLGHEVATLHEGEAAPGRMSLRWDGSDRSGRPVAPGVYLIRAETAEGTAARRVLRLR